MQRVSTSSSSTARLLSSLLLGGAVLGVLGLSACGDRAELDLDDTAESYGLALEREGGEGEGPSVDGGVVDGGSGEQAMCPADDGKMKLTDRCTDDASCGEGKVCGADGCCAVQSVDVPPGEDESMPLICWGFGQQHPPSPRSMFVSGANSLNTPPSGATSTGSGLSSDILEALERGDDSEFSLIDDFTLPGEFGGALMYRPRGSRWGIGIYATRREFAGPGLFDGCTIGLMGSFQF